jgi:hypothetical protein
MSCIDCGASVGHFLNCQTQGHHHSVIVDRKMPVVIPPRLWTEDDYQAQRATARKLEALANENRSLANQLHAVYELARTSLADIGRLDFVLDYSAEIWISHPVNMLLPTNDRAGIDTVMKLTLLMEDKRARTARRGAPREPAS